MTSTTKLSVIILYQKRTQLLSQAVKSAQFADQIIKVKNTKITDFSQVRNQALNQAQHKWVFFLDSDEVIKSESIKEIQAIIANDQLDGVIVNRQDIFYNQALKHGEAGQTKLVRMGKKEKINWDRPVHEVARVDGVIGQSTIKITHYAHNSLTEFINSVAKYAQIEAEYRLKNKNPIKNINLITFPIGKFILNYFLKLGCLDGWRGLSYALIMSLHSLCVRVFQYETQIKLKS